MVAGARTEEEQASCRLADPAGMPEPVRSRRLEVIFAGFGGQGVMLMGQLVAYSAMDAGLEVTWMPSYGPEQRGGTANCTVVVAEEEIASPIVARPHVAVVMNTPSLERFEPRVVPHGVLLVDSSLVPGPAHREDIDLFYVPAAHMAGRLGSEKMANMVMTGALAAATGILPLEALSRGLTHLFTGYRDGPLAANRRALAAGWDAVPVEVRHPFYFLRAS